MTQRPTVWLASYPRSGNTFLRTILFQCFGLRSASVYPKDLGGNAQLEAAAGHIEHAQGGRLEFGDAAIRAIKTHGRPQGNEPAIYMVRHGASAIASLHDFIKGRKSIEELISGYPGSITWSDHLAAWSPRTRPNTLLLRFEDMVRDGSATVRQVASFLNIEPVALALPNQDAIGSVDGRWVRPRAAERSAMTVEQEDLLWAVHGAALSEYGYSRS